MESNPSVASTPALFSSSRISRPHPHLSYHLPFRCAARSRFAGVGGNEPCARGTNGRNSTSGRISGISAAGKSLLFLDTHTPLFLWPSTEEFAWLLRCVGDGPISRLVGKGMPAVATPSGTGALCCRLRVRNVLTNSLRRPIHSPDLCANLLMFLPKNCVWQA